jgi:hypothetical protein
MTAADERSLTTQNIRLLQENSAQSAYLRMLWCELQNLADASAGACTRISTPQLTQAERDALQRLGVAVAHARTLLSKGGA